MSIKQSAFVVRGRPLDVLSGPQALRYRRVSRAATGAFPRALATVAQATVLGVFAAMLVLACTARAATPVNSFAPLSSVPSGFGPGTTSPFGNADGVADIAVGAAGNIFFPDPAQGFVDVWSPDAAAGGVPLTQFDAYGTGGVAPQNIAVDPSDDTVYVNSDPGFGVGISKFTSDGNATPTYTYDSTFSALFGSRPGGLAVDPTTHDVLVADPDAGVIFRFSSTGTLIDSFDGGGSLHAPIGVAAGPSGAFYVIDSSSNTVQRYSNSGVAQGPLPLTDGALPSAITTNPSTGDVAVLDKTGTNGQVEVFSSSGTRLFVAPVGSIIDTGAQPPTDVHGLAWDSANDRLYVSVGRGVTYVLARATQAGVDAPVVISSGRNTARVTVDVATDGIPTAVWLEYCRASDACSSFSASNPSNSHNPWRLGPLHQGVNDPTQDTITDDLPLSSNTTWRIRAVADNGTLVGTSDATTFVSPLLVPGVETRGAGSVAETTAEISGTIDTVGDQTAYHFEYGTTASYGGRVPAAMDAAAGGQRTVRTVVKTLTGLQPGTVYHYRLVAHNSAGLAEGADRTFTTARSGDLPPQRAYEQVTPVDKEGAQVNADTHTQVAADGSGIAVSTASSTPDGETTNMRQNYVTWRGNDDWLKWQPVDAPQNVKNGLFEASTAAISPDFEHALVISNRKLAPGGIAGGGNMYIEDLETGSYTLVAASSAADAYVSLAAPQRNESIYISGAPDFSWITFVGLTSFLPGAPSSAVYRWSRADGLSMTSLMPDGSMPSSPVLVRAVVPYARTTSNDGQITYFGLDTFRSTGPIYRRANGETTLVSHSDGTNLPSSFAVPGVLDAVSPDGRYAVFHTVNPDIPPLTAHPVDPNGGAVYRYDAFDDSIAYVADLHERAGGSVLASDNLDTIYVDQSVFTPQHGPIVVWRNGVLRTVDPNGGSDETGTSSDGRYFSWVDSEGRANLYDYDANASVCASCPADGSAHGVARTRSISRSIGNRIPQILTDEGTLFFDSPVRLVSADHNGARDVYAYRAGRLALISPGDRDFDAQFVDASADGRDVFFQTDQGLVSQDIDESTDVYDARVGGGFAKQNPPTPPAPCVRNECGEAGTGPVTSPPAASQVVNGSSLRRTNQQRVKVSLGKVKFTSKSVRITFQASQRGRVTVSGSRVTRTMRNVSKSGTYSMSVPLSKKARSMLRAHKKLKVSLKVSLYGGWGSASAKYSRTLGK